MSAQQIARSHGLVLSRVASEHPDIDDVAKLLKQHIDHSSVLEWLHSVNVIVDFALIEPGRGGDYISDLFDAAVEANKRYSVCIGGDNETFTLVWTKKKFKDKDAFVSYVLDEFKSSLARWDKHSPMYYLPDLLRGID